MDEDEATFELNARRRSGGNANTLAFDGPGSIARAISFSDHQSWPARISFFDPNRLLAVIVVLFWPLKYFPIVLVPAVILAGLTTFKHWNDITPDLRHLLFGDFAFAVHLVFGLLIVNFGARLSMGAVIRASGGAVHDFGLTFFLGFIPRFYIDRSGIPLLNRGGQVWAFGAPLIVRLSYIVVGVIIWATYRSSGTWLANFALLVSQVGLWAFLIAATPLLPGDGYNWLATYLRQPMLRRKALRALKAKLLRQQLPPQVRRDEVPMLIFFALGSIVAMLAVVSALLILWGTVLIRNLQGMGGVVFVALLASFVMWVFSLKSRRSRRRQQIREGRLLAAMMVGQAPEADSRSAKQCEAPRSGRWRRLLTVGAAVAVVLVPVSFLPYSYDPAGPFKILPAQRSEAVAQIDGQVADIAVREGDWVNAGQVLAHLSSSDQQRNVDLARQDLKDAETRLAQLGEEQSGRSKVEPPSSDMQREFAHSEVERLRDQLDSDEAGLERTTVRAPAAGFVTTPNAQLLTGVWLDAGDKFLQIDDTNVVEAEIDIPQGDIGLIKPGAKVWLRPWSEDGQEFVGSVTQIAPFASIADDDEVGKRRPPLRRAQAPLDSATPVRPSHRTAVNKIDGAANDGGGSTGVVVRVKASVPNAGTWLRSEMTGYAKIRGPEMTVGQAYLRLCSRFLTVQLWSWVP